MCSHILLLPLVGWREGEELEAQRELEAWCSTEGVCVCVSLPCSPVDKAQSRRQSGLVCSLLVVSLLLSAVVGEEGELSG